VPALQNQFLAFVHTRHMDRLQGFCGMFTHFSVCPFAPNKPRPEVARLLTLRESWLAVKWGDRLTFSALRFCPTQFEHD
jgi:hypothetical protein